MVAFFIFRNSRIRGVSAHCGELFANRIATLPPVLRSYLASFDTQNTLLMRPWTHFSLLILVAVAWSCGTSTAVGPAQPSADYFHQDGPAVFGQWKHRPLHPDDHRPVTFSAEVSDPLGVVRVELYLKEYELYNEVVEGGFELPAKRRRSGGAWGRVKVWEFADAPQRVLPAYVHQAGFAAATNVEYFFRVINRKGLHTDRMATFDAGTSPWPQDKVLLYATSNRPMHERINLCFVPDVDYGGDNRQFLSDTERMIHDGFHQNNKITDRKEEWAFYYTQRPTDGKMLLKHYEQVARYPDYLLRNEIEGIDAFGVLHRANYTDRTLPMESLDFLRNNLFTSEAHNFGTAIHEMAHAIFKLNDEYERCVCFKSGGSGNMFPTREACRDFNRSHGFAADETYPVTTAAGATWYTPERPALFETRAACQAFARGEGLTDEACSIFVQDGRDYYWAEPATCIMWDDGDAKIRPFQRACAAVIDDYYAQLENSHRLASPDLVPARDTRYSVPNLFGFEPVVELIVKQVDDEVELAFQTVKYGSPTKAFVAHSIAEERGLPGEAAEAHAGHAHYRERTGKGEQHIQVRFTTDVEELIRQLPPFERKRISYASRRKLALELSRKASTFRAATLRPAQ